MADIITEGALLLCNKGAAPSQLKVTSQQFSSYDDKLIATEKDAAPQSNIPSFGVCMVTRSKCTPATMKWDAPADLEDVEGSKVLLKSSTCKCAIGGTISIKDKGHGAQGEMA